MACHILCSIPDAYEKNTVIPFDVLCQSELRDSEKCCECVKMVFVGTDMS